MTKLFARLQQYDPKRHHTMRVFVLGNQRFNAGEQVEVDQATANVLRTIHQSYYDALSPLAFEVGTKQDEAAAPGQPAEAVSGAPPQENDGGRKSTKKGKE